MMRFLLSGYHHGLPLPPGSHHPGFCTSGQKYPRAHYRNDSPHCLRLDHLRPLDPRRHLSGQGEGFRHGSSVYGSPRFPNPDPTHPPNAIFPTLVMASMDIGSYVLNFSALSFLGLGAEVGYADWGQMISFARNWIPRLADYWYIIVYPGMAILLFVLSWNLIGDAFRDIVDPKLRRPRG